MNRPPDRGWTWLRDAAGEVVRVVHHGHAGRLEVRRDPGEPWAAPLRRARLAAEAGAPAGARVETAADGRCAWGDPPTRPPVDGAPVSSVLFFESLMNAELPHNDGELSQGVLHLASALGGLGIDVRFANVKMAIVGTDRPVQGLETLGAALAKGPVELVCVTVLEGYWEGVVSLIRTLRELGCRAHVAVGGVMPSLAPEVVAAHLPDVSFVARGAGEGIVRALATILGPGASVDRPLSDAQVGALLGLNGLYVRDNAGGRLLACHPAVVNEVPDLDGVPLDLGLLAARHFTTGVEIASSRGCVHRCVFCSILGRERYQARTAENVLSLLGAYDQRLRQLFGEAVPRHTRRVHFADDDFACDRDRAIGVFRGILGTPFRLASVQVSVADLCRRVDGVLEPAIDVELFDSIRPECFDDHGRPIDEADFVADHRTRRWSSYLQVGVEAFSDAELVRLGKGYKREHVRTVVSALAARRLHHDAYYILANRHTTFAEFIAGVDEIVRLKSLYPLYFHVRFPVVPRLVSYATSASWRRLVRQGDHAAFALRGVLQEPDHPEFDYPLVDHDVPADPIVDRFVDAEVFTDAGHYAGTYARLHERLAAAWAEGHDPEVEYAARLVDDRARRRWFELLDLARRAGHREPGDPAHPATKQLTPALRKALAGRTEAIQAAVEAALGPTEGWLPAFSRTTMGGVTRLVLIPTWQCELRCNYCYIPKQDGRVMDPVTARRAIDLLCSSERTALTAQFFGGEALLEWPLVRDTIAWGIEQAARRGKSLDFVLSTNGWSLDEEKLAWLAGKPVKLELSLDGDPETQRRYRPAARAGEDSYENGIASRAAAIVESGLAYDVIMVVHPERVGRLAANFAHIAELGFRRIQINFALGKMWSAAQKAELAQQLFALAGWLRPRPEVVFVNAEHAPMPIRLNGEITVDWDGTIYGGNAFLHETEHKPRFRRGHLDDLGNFDRYWMDAPKNRELVEWSYGAAVTKNNLAVGVVMTGFLQWWRRELGLSDTP